MAVGMAVAREKRKEERKEKGEGKQAGEQAGRSAFAPDPGECHSHSPERAGATSFFQRKRGCFLIA